MEDWLLKAFFFLLLPVKECENSSPTSYFWYRKALDITDSIDETGSFNPYIICCLLVAWTIVCLGMFKGIKTSVKVTVHELLSRELLCSHCQMFTCSVLTRVPVIRKWNEELCFTGKKPNKTKVYVMHRHAGILRLSISQSCVRFQALPCMTEPPEFRDYRVWPISVPFLLCCLFFPNTYRPTIIQSIW